MNCFKSFTSCSLLFFYAGFSGFSQVRDTIGLNQVVVESTRIKNFNTGHQYIAVDSVVKQIYSAHYLKDILNCSTPLQVKVYGAGISSISGRGTSEKRTPVLWNGFNLQNIMSANVDMAQLHTSFFEDIKIQMGGSSALFGSGAVGAVVNLSNVGEFNKKLQTEVGTYLGSFSQYTGNVKSSFGNKKYAFSLKYFYNKAKNNFPFEAAIRGNLVKGTQTNAKAEQHGVMFSNYFLINSKQAFNVHLWYQQADKNIAPTLSDFATNTIASANQKDKIARVSAEWGLHSGNFAIWARSGIFHNKLDYSNPTWGSSNNKGLASISEVESSIAPFQNLRLNGGINYTYEEAFSSTFPETKTRNRMALFSSFKFGDDITQMTFSVRDEAVNGHFIPATYSVGVQQVYFENLSFIGNVSKNYRLPTFNDLYYKDAYSEGNPGLKPETGISYEGGFSFKKALNNISWVISSSYFHSDMKDWMNWAERQDGIWTVYNVDQAIIDGVESMVEGKLKFLTHAVSLKLMYTYQDAVNKTLSKKIEYVPYYKFGFSISYLRRDFSLLYQHSFVSRQFTDPENTSSIDAYSTGDIAASYNFHIHKVMKIAADLHINNLMNKDYITVLNYPMPKRNFMAGLRFIF